MPTAKSSASKDNNAATKHLDPENYAIYGYVFVRFDKGGSVDKALSVRNHEILGKKLDVEQAYIIDGSVSQSLSKLQLKVFFKGFPQETTRDELVNLLAPFGEIRSLRIVEKNGKNIGFVVLKHQNTVKKLLNLQYLPFTKNGLIYNVKLILTISD